MVDTKTLSDTPGSDGGSTTSIQDPEAISWPSGDSVSVGDDGPQTPTGDSVPYWANQDEIVISGLSGKFPESANVAEFAENLFAGVDMVTEDDRRWAPGYHGLPTRHGKLKEINKFDAAFFGVSPKQATNMDPQLRMMLEVVHEAIVDSGVDPQTIRGSRTGVFVGCSVSETFSALTRDADEVTGYSLTGCTSSMFANRISYSFDFRGPSFPVDTACSSSLLAIQLAVDHMRQGHCEQAVVVGAILNLLPNVALQFQRLGMLGDDGKCRSFDSSGKGYVRAECIAAVYLQRSPCARRIYATIVNVKSNTDGFKEAGITVPSGIQQQVLLEETYAEADVDPMTVTYVEAHGTGTKVGDPQESHAITNVFCNGSREAPLLIGSVKSNMGHAEPASALASITKVLCAMEKCMLPPNLHYNEPNPYIPALLDGRMEVVTKPTKWDGGLVGINSFGFGGANTHCILKSNQIETVDRPLPLMSNIPKLVCVSGRTKESVHNMLQAAIDHSENAYFHALLAEHANHTASQGTYRGSVMLHRDSNQEPLVDIQKVAPIFAEGKRPVWFVYSGMGCQWPGMAQQLMRIDLFKHSMMQSSEALKQFGVSPYELLMDGNEELFNTMHCMTCITAVQIALTDVLRSLNVDPDGIVGHSTGEMACAYVDGCLSRAQTMTLAYYRGMAIMDGGVKGSGAMAAVGLTWEQAKERCPEGVNPACHNGVDSVTISGESEKVVKFVESLKKEEIFAKSVNSSGVAFHSPAMQKIKPRLMADFEKVISEPRARSTRWISTSLSPEDRHDDKMCSAEYHVNNAMNPVYFHEAIIQIPVNAVVIEISPHSLLWSILKRTLPSSATSIGICKANQESELEFVLGSLSKIHQSGVPIRVDRLYAPVQYPVPRGTPMISPLLRWEHEQDWYVASAAEMATASGNGVPSSVGIKINPANADSGDQYLMDHIIDGRALYPFTGYVCLAWKAICRLNDIDKWMETPVLLHDIRVHKATILKGELKLDVVVSPGDGSFSIIDAGTVACTGRIEILEEDDERLVDEHKIPNVDDIKNPEAVINLSATEIYKELRLRGYEYAKQFHGLHSSKSGTGFSVALWNDNWVTFLDALLQAALISERSDILKLPTGVRELRINPKQHQRLIIDTEDGHKFIHVHYHRFIRECNAGGVQMRDLTAETAPKRSAQASGRLYLERVRFTKHKDLDAFNTEPVMKRQQLAEYSNHITMKLVDVWKVIGKKLCSLPHYPLIKEALLKLVEPEEHNSVTKGPFDALVKELEKCEEAGQMTQLVLQYAEVMSDDPLYASCHIERLFKPIVDTVVENFRGHKLKAALVNAHSMAALTKFDDLASSHPLVNVVWTIVKADNDQLLEDSAKSEDHETVTFDSLNSFDAVPESLKNQYDFVLLDRCLHWSTDVARCLHRIKQLVHDDGFVVVVENTNQYELTFLVDALRKDQLPSAGDGQRVYGLYLRHDDWLTEFENAGFDCVAYQTDASVVGTVYLIRKRVQRSPTIVDIDDVSTFKWIEPLQKLIEEREADEKDDRTIWLKSDKVLDNGIIGLAYCLREEGGTLANRIRSIANLNTDCDQEQLVLDESTMATIMHHDLHSNMIRNGDVGSFIHFTAPKDEHTLTMCEHAFINTLVRGDVSSLTFVESSNKYFDQMTFPTPTELVRVYYAPLNFRDIMLAYGRIPPDAVPGGGSGDRDCLLGTEFVGRLGNGKRVMGVLPGGTLATSLLMPSKYLMDVPDAWTMEEAATVPMTYCTAYYALCVRGRLRAGESVLIHSGTGGVGQAAIAVALSMGCTVYTTCGSEAKRKFLLENFPALTDAHIFNSRSTQFEREIMVATEGEGVNMVLNSLSDSKLQASVRCMAQHARFLEIGKFDLANNTALGMRVFLKNITFHGILLDSLLNSKTNEVHPDWISVCELFYKGIADGIVRPLQSTLYTASQVEEAFRYMSSGKHMGKIVLQLRPEERTLIAPPSTLAVKGVKRALCHPKHSYLITGGLGGFGLELANWLVIRGAKHLILTSRTGVKTGYQARYVHAWKQRGVNVHISTRDIADEAECAALINECCQMGALGGVFHLAMVLRDTMFDNQNAENFVEAGKMKYLGTKHLDMCTRTKCDREAMQWFVVFSSVTAGRGNAGQTSYGWANSTMERIVEHRRAAGFSGMAIQWGAIGDVGVIIDSMGDNTTVVGGTMPQRMASCLQALDTFLCWNEPIVSSYVRADMKKPTVSSGADIITTLAHIVGADPASLNLDSTLGYLGIDSLMAVEIRQTLERDYKITLSTKDIRTITLRKLQTMAMGDGVASSSGEQQSDTEKLRTQMNTLFKLRVDVNELAADEELTRANNVSDGPTAYFVHSIEGIVAPVRHLCNQLTVSFNFRKCDVVTDDARVTSFFSR